MKTTVLMKLSLANLRGQSARLRESWGSLRASVG